MKRIISILAASAIGAVLSSCHSSAPSSDVQNTDPAKHNICLIIDGTDRLTHESCFPLLSTDQIVAVAQKIADHGVGTLYVSYIDEKSVNNAFSVFAWDKERPDPLPQKPETMPTEVYKRRVQEHDALMDEYVTELESAVARFSTDTKGIVALAYSDAVAGKSKASDVNGAINRAVRMLKAESDDVPVSYIVVVSDLCDNIGCSLEDIPDGMELVVINTNINSLDVISKQCPTFDQAIKYIF